MKKIVLAMIGTSLAVSFFSELAYAQVYSYPNTCVVNIEYSYGVYPNANQCTCPYGSIYVNRTTTGTYGENRFICQGTQIHTQMCRPMVAGQFYTQDYAQCRCPDGTVVGGNGQGYTNSCNWNTNVTCWDGSLATNQNSCPPIRYCTVGGSTYGCYNPPNPQPLTCWDGSTITMVGQYCPQYKFCPGDTVTKHALGYTCPAQTQTCWDGTVIPVYQSCPTQQQNCNNYYPYTYQYWNTNPCQNNYIQPYNSFGTYRYDNYQWYSPSPYYNNYNNWNWNNQYNYTY